MSDRDGDGDDDDDVPQLSAAALAALQEFYAENEAGHSAVRDGYTVGGIKEDWTCKVLTLETPSKTAKQISPYRRLEAAVDLWLRNQAYDRFDPYNRHVTTLVHLSKRPNCSPGPMDRAARANVRMSQFWYSEETATRLAEEAIEQAGKQGRIACISAPSVYQKLKQLESENVEGSRCVSAVLLEFDRRFAAYGDEFIFYDYNNPLCLPEDVVPQSFDLVVADPPYLSEECLSKVALTVKYLTKSKILLCTGAIMEEHAGKLMDVKICSYLPKHNHNLANEFRCYVNYESGLL